MIIRNDADRANASAGLVQPIAAPIAAPIAIHPDEVKKTMESRDPNAVQVAVIDQGQHAKWVTTVAERASLSSRHNVKYLPSTLEWGEVTSKLERIADNPGNIKVINCSFGTSVLSKFANIFGAEKADIINTFGGNPARWTPKQKEAVQARVMDMLSVAKAIVDHDRSIVSSRLTKVLQRLNDKGISVVVAAGNNGTVDGLLKQVGIKPPAFLYDNLMINRHTSPNLIVVGASTTNDRAARAAKFTSRNKFVDIAADGTQIQAGNGAPVNGTSFSAPQVAGLVADLYAKHPKLTPRDISQILKASALPGTSEPGKTGAGVVNRARAMQIAKAF